MTAKIISKKSTNRKFLCVGICFMVKRSNSPNRNTAFSKCTPNNIDWVILDCSKWI